MSIISRTSILTNQNAAHKNSSIEDRKPSEAHLPSEHHKRRIQRNRQKEMADYDSSKRIDSHEVVNAPVPRKRRRTCDHQTRASNAKYKHVFETLDEARDFFEKGCVFDFFGGGAPGHVDFKEVAEEGLGDVHGDSA
jgi:hypothetical protein